MVDRYTALVDEVKVTARMAATPNGTYVSAADYEKAEARIAQLEAENAQIRAHCCEAWTPSIDWLSTRVEQLQAALNVAKVGLRVIARGGAAGKTDRQYAAGVLDECSSVENEGGK